MSISPHITFKAGKCEFDPTTKKVKPLSRPGFIYLYTGADDDLVHFCWRARDASLSDPQNLDLVMVPTDGTFKAYSKPRSPATSGTSSPTTGRVCVLKFASSETRHLFWLQSREQPAGQEHRNVFSDRDLKLVSIVDSLLQGEELGGEEVNEVRAMGRGGGGEGGGSGSADEDTAMDDLQDETGGAGANATGGDVRQEGEESREGGADGGRANLASQPNNQPNLASLLASINAGPSAQQHPQSQHISTALTDLLPPSTTIPALSDLSEAELDRILLDHLPLETITLSQSTDSPSTSVKETLATMREGEKRQILEKILRSPQLTQALSSITSAIRDGGLTSVSQAMGVNLEGKGNVPGTGEVLNGGAAVEVFLEALRRDAEKSQDDR